MRKQRDCLCSAIEIWEPSNWSSIEIDGKYLIPNSNGGFNEHSIAHELTPEKQYYKKELVDFLTKDAKYVIKLLLDTPEELLDCIIGENGEPKKYRIMAFLQVSGWGRKRVFKTIKEICKFVGEYYGQ